MIFLFRPTISSIWRRNHGSYLQEAKTCLDRGAEAEAWAIFRMRSGVGVPSAARMAFLSSPSPICSISTSLKPVSRGFEAAPTPSASIPGRAADRHHSPTDFMAVVRLFGGAGEFLEGKARDLVTT